MHFRVIGVSLILAVGLLAWGLPQARAQDGNQLELNASLPSSFDELLTQWNELDQKLRAKQEEYSQADAATKPVIKKEYTDLVDKANLMAPVLRKQAMEKYKAEPNQDDNLTKLLIGMILDSIHGNRQSEALEIVNTLCKHKAKMEYFEAMRNAGNRISATDIPFVEELIQLRREAETDDLPLVKLNTNKGVITIQLFENEAPETVGNFIHLVEKNFYNGLTFHRVLEGFVAQGGDPAGNGTGGPGYTIYCECEKPGARKHFDGYVSMAHAGKDTGGSQFFIILKGQNAEHLNGRHTVFGRVVEGMDVVRNLQLIDPNKPDPKITPDKIISATVERKREHEYVPHKVSAE